MERMFLFCVGLLEPADMNEVGLIDFVLTVGVTHSQTGTCSIHMKNEKLHSVLLKNTAEFVLSHLGFALI
jgi:hypothetical protein